MNDTNTLINKVKTLSNKVDRANQVLRQQELRRIMQSKPKTHTERMDIVDALRKIANDINPSILR